MLQSSRCISFERLWERSNSTVDKGWTQWWPIFYLSLFMRWMVGNHLNPLVYSLLFSTGLGMNDWYVTPVVNWVPIALINIRACWIFCPHRVKEMSQWSVWHQLKRKTMCEHAPPLSSKSTKIPFGSRYSLILWNKLRTHMKEIQNRLCVHIRIHLTWRESKAEVYISYN